ncbi:Hypothetical protein NocV09_11500010, partial [Nannochloropsis oceanica]
YLEEIYRQETVSFDGVSSTLKKLLREGESNASKEGEIDYGLLRKLILYVDSDEFASKNPGPAQGSVLVFLPGVGEITRLLSELKSASSGTLPLSIPPPSLPPSFGLHHFHPSFVPPSLPP